MRLRLPRSLRTRVFLASALVAVASLAIVLLFVTARVAAQAEQELQRGLTEAADLLEQQHAARVEELMVVADLVADLPKLKAAVETADPPTVEPLASDYRARIHADALLVTDRTGRVLAGVGAPTPALPGSVREALAGRRTLAFRPAPDGIFQMVTVPIVLGPDPPEVLGTLGLAVLLDDARADRYRPLVESELAFAMGGEVLASTLEPAHTATLRSLLGTHRVTSVELGGNDYVGLVRELKATGTGGLTALILRSRTERLAFLRQLRSALVAAAVVAMVLAVLASYVVARTVTRPLTAITGALRDMSATGDFTHKITRDRRWEDEDANVLASTVNSLTESIVRFQRESVLKERLSALGRLSTVIAHEVRNPLMIIKSSLRGLRRAGVPPAEVAEAAADIDHEVDRLERIVRDVLDFARPVRPEWAPTDLNALCREAAQAALEADGAPSWRASLHEGVGTVVTDAERLRTALVNILANAREAVKAREQPHEGGPGVELRTTPSPDGRVAITVADRGIGIPPETLPHIFEPYFSTKRAGTGLGLAIAKNIVESLGGTLLAESAAREGTAVRIELPVRPAAAGPASPA